MTQEEEPITDFPDHSFWNFSVAIHQVSGVHDACLALQTRYGLDVNLLFFCCWAGGAKGGLFDYRQIRRAMDSVSAWQEEIVRPIWKARWRLKPCFGRFAVERTEALRRKLIEAELDAEHIEQLHLADSVVVEGDPNLSEETRLDYAIANLFSYLDGFMGSKVGLLPHRDELIEPLMVLVSACFPGTDKDRLSSLIADRWRWGGNQKEGDKDSK
jgi:uncharacterized protein (TIGR02444 family)